MKSVVLSVLTFLAMVILITVESISISENIRLATYCSTHAHCPESSTCGEHNYCECLPGYASFDRLLNSCLPITSYQSYFDPRFSFLSKPCRERINCPGNSYCDPVGKCSCVPDYITLDDSQCSFITAISSMDLRWRSTRLTCRADVNCPEESRCVSSECICNEGKAAGGRLVEGFHTNCEGVPGRAAPGIVITAGTGISIGALSFIALTIV